MSRSAGVAEGGGWLCLDAQHDGLVVRCAENVSTEAIGVGLPSNGESLANKGRRVGKTVFERQNTPCCSIRHRARAILSSRARRSKSYLPSSKTEGLINLISACVGRNFWRGQCTQELTLAKVSSVSREVVSGPCTRGSSQSILCACPRKLFKPVVGLRLRPGVATGQGRRLTRHMKGFLRTRS